MQFRTPLRLPDSDKLRAKASTNICTIPGCCATVSEYTGPGSLSMCRHHQLKQKIYGGPSKNERKYTFHKEWQCSCCGYDPRTDSRFDCLTDTASYYSAVGSALVCDHIIRQTDGGSDLKENIQTLCKICDLVKSATHKDWHHTGRD